MITKNDLKLAKKIKALRRKNKYTQQELADKVKVTPKYIQYIEAAKRTPSLKLLYRLSKMLGVKPNELFN